MTDPTPALLSGQSRSPGSPGRAVRSVVILAAVVGLAIAASGARGEDAPLPAEPTAVKVQVEDTLPFPAEEVRAVLLDLEAFRVWFPALREWRVLVRRDRSAEVYGRQRLPWPFSDRDYVVRYRWTDDEEGLDLEAVGQSGASPGAPDGVVRVERLRSEWRVSPDGDSARVRYAYEGDHDLPLPRAFLTRLWERHGDRVVSALAGEVERRRRERAP